MITDNIKRIIFVLTLLLPLFALDAIAQNTIITGVIMDAKEKDPMPYVTVLFKGTSIITRSDEDGKFTISTSLGLTELQFSYVGYKTSLVVVKTGQTQDIVVKLEPEATSLNEVVVTAGKRPRYRNKANPAVELIRQVIDHKDQN
ncbi:MAG: Membrane protein, partial [Pedobacter sp.]|nr:Membrane protein [Pedobacter sp.]